jgi:hypothetical protein
MTLNEAKQTLLDLISDPNISTSKIDNTTKIEDSD